ncbi:hypothetical protein GW17_00019940 [Ensete ventricosum]|nr:hypothetical protein GW17_00019940 [Ensete ventricosum]
MSRETLECHWGRHHRAHVASLNNLIAGTDLDGMGLDEIVVASYNKGNPLPPFVHAAQVTTVTKHPDTLETPTSCLYLLSSHKANRLDVGNAVNPCPSEKDNKLVVLKSPNAVNPIIWDYSPLLAIDVWEVKVLNSSLNYFTFTFLDYFCNLTLMQIFFWLHSTLTILITRSVPHLYLQNRRADYVSIFLEKLVSWEVVNHRLDVAMERAAERAREDETRRQEDDAEMTCSEAEEMYLDTDTDDSEAE